MTESFLYQTLTTHGLTTPKFISFSALASLPLCDFFPVVLKVESSKAVHKSEVGGVALNIHSQQELAEALETMKKTLATHDITLDETDRFLVAQLVEGFELYAGVVDDPIFGKTILFGRGGIFLEMDKDICYIHQNSTKAEIFNALNCLKMVKMFTGFRGMVIDKEQICEFIQTFQKFLQTNPNIIECDFNPIKATAEGLIIVDARIKEGAAKTFCDFKERPFFFDNKSVAILGVSTSPTKVGYAVAKNALTFEGELYFINTKGGELFGKPLYSSLEALNKPIDTGVICLPSEAVLQGVRDLGKMGCKNVIVISAGFKECGNNDSEKVLGDIAREYGMNLIGPNCLGYYSGQTSLNLTFAASQIKAGGLALLSQSGAVLTALMDKAEQFDIGFSHIISIGNMADMAFGEIMAQLDTDPTCQAISVYAEGIQNGPLFLESLRRCTKPVYIFKAGQTGEAKKAAFSHTGNLSGDYGMFKGLIESVDAKVRTVTRIESLLFSPLISTGHCVVVTNAGGPASIFTDGLIKAGGKLHTLTKEQTDHLNRFLPGNWSLNNPIDVIGDAGANRYADTLNEVVIWNEIDTIFVIVTPQFMTDMDAISTALIRSVHSSQKKIIPLFLGGPAMKKASDLFKANHALFFESIEEALAVFN